MSEWTVGDDSDQEVEEVDNDRRHDDAVPMDIGSDDEVAEGNGRTAKSTKKRPSKEQLRRMDEEAEYEDDDEKPAPKAKSRPKSDLSSNEPVSTRVLSFLALNESSLGVPVSSRMRSMQPGKGLTPDLVLQPRCMCGESGAGIELRPHQLAGLNWIKARYERGLSCLLADEMGLGKTAQAIAFLSYLYDLAQSPTTSSSSSGHNERIGPFLVVAPLTVLDNWASEFASFSPSFLIQVYTGSKSERQAIQDSIREYIRAQPKSQRSDPELPFHVLLTTYECILNDVDFLSRFRWRAAIIDEAHRLKNSESALSRCLLSDYSLSWKLLLSGTPLQNNLAEIWSLLHFMQPSVFDEKEAFIQEFKILEPSKRPQHQPPQQQQGVSDAVDYSNSMSMLHSMLRPFLLRRLKSQCALDIPPKSEVILRTGLTNLQRNIYKNLLLKNWNMIGSATATTTMMNNGENEMDGSSPTPAPSSSAANNKNMRALLNLVQSLRKCVVHPYLFPGIEPEPFREGPHLYESSSKFRLLVKLLAILKRQNRRVLLFSTSVATLDIVQDVLSLLKYSYERLDGSVRGEERYQAIERYKGSSHTTSSDGPTFVFLLSTRAGGVGLNLVQADTVIFLDADWNPQVDLQAQARCHRIGQRKPVLVIRLMAANTVEEVILRRTRKKLAMTYQILERGRFHHATGTGMASEEGGATDMSLVNNAAGGDDPETIGRFAQDLRSIIQYGLDDLFGDASKASEGKDAAEVAESDGDDMGEQELEAIITSQIEQAQHAMASGGAEASAKTRKRGKRLSASLAAETKQAEAPPSFRPSLARIATVALPSLEPSAAPHDAVAATQIEEEEPDIYTYEGKNYKELQAQDRDIDEELVVSAAAGNKALQRMLAEARASGALPATMDDDEGRDRHADGVSGSGRKRKAVEQESLEERAARLERVKELAQRRAESARKKREEAAAAKEAARIALWESHGYESLALPMDMEAVEQLEAELNELDSTGMDGSSTPEPEPAIEWGMGDEEEEEERKESDEVPATGRAHHRRKGRLQYVVGDVTCPFEYDDADGPPGYSAEDGPSSASSSAAASSTSAASAAASSSVAVPPIAIVLAPVDASGRWGKGGLFRALDQLSTLISASYELAAEMDDLKMGDVHVLELNEDMLQPSNRPVTVTHRIPKHRLHVALSVALKRDKHQQYGPPSLHGDSLATCLKKIALFSMRHRDLTLHLPRLGGTNDGSSCSWYGIERMLRKYFIQRGIDVYVYYYQRNRPQYQSPAKQAMERSLSNGVARGESQHVQRNLSFDTSSQIRRSDSDDDDELAAAIAASLEEQKSHATAASSAAPSTAAAAAAVASDDVDLDAFKDIFTGKLIYIDRPDQSEASTSGDSTYTSSADEERLLTRYLTAYDGEVSSMMTPDVTHVVTAQPFLTPRVSKLLQQAAPDARVVKVGWVQSCVNKGSIDDSPQWLVKPRGSI